MRRFELTSMKSQGSPHFFGRHKRAAIFDVPRVFRFLVFRECLSIWMRTSHRLEKEKIVLGMLLESSKMDRPFALSVEREHQPVLLPRSAESTANRVVCEPTKAAINHKRAAKNLRVLISAKL